METGKSFWLRIEATASEFRLPGIPIHSVKGRRVEVVRETCSFLLYEQGEFMRSYLCLRFTYFRLNLIFYSYFPDWVLILLLFLQKLRMNKNEIGNGEERNEKAQERKKRRKEKNRERERELRTPSSKENRPQNANRKRKRKKERMEKSRFISIKTCENCWKYRWNTIEIEIVQAKRKMQNCYVVHVLNSKWNENLHKLYSNREREKLFHRIVLSSIFFSSASNDMYSSEYV